jgi:hypothetical protein
VSSFDTHALTCRRHPDGLFHDHQCHDDTKEDEPRGDRHAGRLSQRGVQPRPSLAGALPLRKVGVSCPQQAYFSEFRDVTTTAIHIGGTP